MAAVRSTILAAMLCATASFGLPHGATAQGTSTASIHGTVQIEGGADADGAQVLVTNSKTGFTSNPRVVRGRFFAPGLEVGGPYVVVVRQIGFQPLRSQLSLSLGESAEVKFVLRRATSQLGEVFVTAERGASVLRSGATTVVRDSVLHRLPTLNRNFYDFSQLAPQVSTKVGFQRGGVSAAGANLRYNSFVINGADDRVVYSSFSAAASSGKSIPLDAVKEYQLLVAPFDVRYGDFAGGLINTVTQSGTNEFHGSAFTFWRNDWLAHDAGPTAPAYDRWQYGFSLGGPIVRDRLNFFIAPELQRLTRPAPGPYLGQPADATQPVPIREADVARFATLMHGYGLAAGSGGFVKLESPLRNLFARVDAAIPRWNSRAIGFVSDGRGASDQLERSAKDFYLSSSTQSSEGRVRLISVQLHTDLPWLGGVHNELVLSRTADRTGPTNAPQPIVRVTVPGVDAGSHVSLIAGSDQGRFRRSHAIKVKDDITLPWGAHHVFALGMEGERFLIQPSGVVSGFGVWTFSSLDSLADRVAEQYEMRKDFGSASVPLRGGQFGAYIGDEFRPGDRVSLTLGVRADRMNIDGTAPYNRVVDSIFARRTDEMPRPRVYVSPRFGFTWDLFGAGRDRLRGGVGIFTGRPPLAWLHPALQSYGVGVGTLRCGPNERGPTPPFQPDYRNLPTACANGDEVAVEPKGDVDLLDRNLRMAQSLRASLAYERQLPWGLVASSELLVTRYTSDFMFANLNLREPQVLDRFGRVMYGTIGTNALPTPAERSHFSEVIDLRNTSGNYARQFSARVEKRFARGASALVSYTYSRMRDVQSPSRIGSPVINLWSDARVVSGRHDEQVLGVALNDLPHRVVTALTYTAPWQRWATGFSFLYVGESGTPFTYTAWGVNHRGDLNADRSNANDPIFVPHDVADTNEIRFSGVSDSLGADNSAAAQAERVRVQRNAFHGFIEATPCLRGQRGRILERNSCREPWSQTTIASVFQAIPVGPRGVEAELDVFNLLALLNADWGHYRVAAPQLLEHVGQTEGAAATPASIFRGLVTSQPIFRFDAKRATWTTLPIESAFQLQVALRYRF